LGLINYFVVFRP